MEIVEQTLAAVCVLIVAVATIAAIAYGVAYLRRRRSIRAMFERHLRPESLDRISITERQFPFHIRVDLQAALDDFVRSGTATQFFGVRNVNRFENFDFPALLNDQSPNRGISAAIGPPQYEQIEVGEDEPLQALQSGLWLLDRGGTRFVILYLPAIEFGACGPEQRARVQVAVANNPAGAAVTRDLFRHLEIGVAAARCYRGKILSLEQENSYYGRASGVKVHRLGKLDRDQVILPAKTLVLLDRNVIEFVANRAARQVSHGDEEGAAVLRSAGDGQDAHDSLFGRFASGAYDAADLGRASGLAVGIHDAGPAVAAKPCRDRGCRSDRARADPHSRRADRGFAQQVAQ